GGTKTVFSCTSPLGTPRRSQASQSGAIAFVVCHGILTERIASAVQVPGNRFAPCASRDRCDDPLNVRGWCCFCRRKWGNRQRGSGARSQGLGECRSENSRIGPQ